MMTRVQYLLSKLAEEANEVSQIALKAQQFGLQEVWPDAYHNPDKLSNEDRLHQELTDMKTVIEMLLTEDYIKPCDELKERQQANIKIHKIAQYFAISCKLKQADDIRI